MQARGGLWQNEPMHDNKIIMINNNIKSIKNNDNNNYKT